MSYKSWCNTMAAAFSPALLGALAFELCAAGQGKTKTETFDSDPRWQGVNNRSARRQELSTIKQDFGYCRSNNAGGNRGEIGGYISPAGEAAYYGKVIKPRTLQDQL